MKILIAGDSTVADYPAAQRPMTGWGQALRDVLPDIEILNYARHGATTKSFQALGLWDKLAANIQPHDLVLIQFGHNDQKPENGVSHELYQQNLTMMVRTAQRKGATPVLCTSTERRHLENGVFTHTLSDMAHLTRRVAEATDTYLIDLNNYALSYYQYSHYGQDPELTGENFVWLTPGDNPNYPEGHHDNTHFNRHGAAVMARYVALRLRRFLSDKPLFDKYYYGACTYPEVWGLDVIKQDIKTMQALHMSFTRIGEFMWEALEPKEDQFDFSLLEQALDLYAQAGIDVVVATPTPTPPRWLTAGHPERCIHNADGTVESHGSRQQACTNNPYYRNRAYLITYKLAQVLAKHPNVVAIQLDNEFKCHVDLCFCDECRKQWHDWLRLEYEDIATLNAKWGTNIWSEAYATFDDVPMPTKTPFLHNSSLQNAFRQFTSESLNDFAGGLCNVIRQNTTLPITHNTSFGFNLLNHALFEQLDFSGFDTYAGAENFGAFSMNLATHRNLVDHRGEFMLLETSTSHAGHIENYIAPHPAGYLTNEAFLTMASGSKSFNYWHFRGHRFGVEQPHAAVVTAWGDPDLNYAEVQQVGELIQQMQPLLAKTQPVRAKVALLYSDEAKRFYNIETGGYLNYRGLITDLYAALLKAGINAEIVQTESDFSQYAVVLAPWLRHVSAQLLAKFQAFKGKLIIGPMTGDRTGQLALPAANGLDRLGEWLGFTKIRQFDVHKLAYAPDGISFGGLVTVFDAPSDWQVLAKAENGQAIAAAHDNVVYLGAMPAYSDPWWTEFVAKQLAVAAAPIKHLDAGIIGYTRADATTTAVYLANMSKEPVQAAFTTQPKQVLGDVTQAAAVVTLPAFSHAVAVFDQQ